MSSRLCSAPFYESATMSIDQTSKTLSRMVLGDAKLLDTHTSGHGTVEIDSRGDLLLVVPGDEEVPSKTLRVCSRALSRVSPLFERMLYGSLAESRAKHAERWSIDLPEDDPWALELFANICHGLLTKVPQSLTIDELFHLTMLTHYYDATETLAPWTDRWTNNIRDARTHDELDLDKILWISLELGQKGLFHTTARTLVMESPGLLSQEDLDEQLGVFPDLTQRIGAIRTQTIQAMLNLFRELSNILVVLDEQPRWCRHASYMRPHRCESMILGSIVFCLTRAGLWPIPEAQHIQNASVPRACGYRHPRHRSAGEEGR